MSVKHIICPEHGHVGTIHEHPPVCTIRSCEKVCKIEPPGGENELKEAQELYYSLGGMPSQSMTPRKAPWYWRRAAKIMRDVREAAAADVVEEQAREYAERDDVFEAVAEHLVIVAGVIADSIRSHVAEFEDEDNDPCPECGNLSLLLMGRRRRRVFLDVDRERKEQGDTLYRPEIYLAILVEEVGELGTAILGEAMDGRGNIREELVQVAAVGVRMIELCDRKVEGWTR